MPNLFSLLGDAWTFYRKQPVLNSVILWLYVLPGSLMNILTTLLASQPEERLDLMLLVIGTILMLSLIIIWGSTCVLLVARRIVKTSAGRTRTSFASLRHEASTLIVPIILTGILQTCFTILWALLLIIPGIIYQIRTGFYHIVVVAEGTTYRDALHRSRDVVKGHTWHVLGYLLGFGLILYAPISLISITGWTVAEMIDIRLTIFFDVLDAGLNGIATALFLIATVSLYRALLKNAKKA